jgi:hypothetical protein
MKCTIKAAPGARLHNLKREVRQKQRPATCVLKADGYQITVIPLFSEMYHIGLGDYDGDYCDDDYDGGRHLATV